MPGAKIYNDLFWAFKHFHFYC